MNFFDLRTAYLITGLLYFTMPFAVWIALKGERSTSVRQWCASGILFGSGVVLLGMRGHLAAWITFELVNVLTNAGLVAAVAALRRQLQRPLGWRWATGLLLLFFAGYEFGRWKQPEGPGYYLVSLVFVAGYFFWISLLARQIAQRERLTSAYWLSLNYVPVGVLMTLQACRLLLNPTDLHPLQTDPLVIALTFVGTIAAVIGNTSFLGIFAERATRQRLEMAQAQAQAAERGRLRRQIAHLDRVRSMGMLSTVLAHELSQPLSSIQLTAEQAEAEALGGHTDSDRRLRHLRTIVSQSRHAREILQRIRQFISPHSAPHSPVSLQAVNAQVLALLHDWLQAEGVDVRLKQAAQPVVVHGDAVQLAQVLVNVYRNAIQACATRPGRTRITTTIAQQGQRAAIEIRDNGAGFSAEALQKNHEGFFSTKSDSLGVGLLISRQIAEQHNGLLLVGNAEGGGALVKLELPVFAG